MTKNKSTKRALLMSALSLMICVSMLIGSTFAWFTDSVTSSGNKIQAGTLKIDLELLEKNEDGSTKWNSIKDSKDPIFNYDKWEPGYTDVKILKVENEGTLALKWIAKFVSASDLTALANVIDVYVKPSADEFGYATDRTDLSGWENVGTVAQFVNTISETTHGNLKAGEKAYLGIALKMQETADNKYQGMDLGGAFDIMILATQLTSETDSFDDQYDKNATYLNKDESGNYLISTAAELVYFADSVNNGKKTYAGETVMLTADIDLANVAWSPIGQTGATEFKGVFDGQSHTIKNMTIVNTDESANCASGLFGWIESHDNNNPVTVKNVKFDNAKVTGNHNVAVVAGYVYGTIENCEVKNSTVIGLNANDDANGDKVGVIAGYVGDSRINNNKVENCVVKGNRDVGGIAGVVHTGVLSFENNTVSNSTVTYVTERTYASAGAITSGRTGYVPNATNDATNNVNVMTELQYAFNTAEDGATITLSEAKDYGTVKVSELKNVTIKGTEGATMIFKTDANTKLENVTLQKVEFEYTGATYDCGIVIDPNAEINNLVVENCTFSGTGAKAGRGLSGQNNSATITFKNCTFENLGYPIYAWGGYKALAFDGCTFDNIKSWAIMPQSGFDGDLTVNNCKFINCLGGGLIKAGTLTAGHTFTFTNNTITGCTIAGDHNWFQFNVSAGTTVINNNIKDGVAWTPTAADGLK